MYTFYTHFYGTGLTGELRTNFGRRIQHSFPKGKFCIPYLYVNFLDRVYTCFDHILFQMSPEGSVLYFHHTCFLLIEKYNVVIVIGSEGTSGNLLTHLQKVEVYWKDLALETAKLHKLDAIIKGIRENKHFADAVYVIFGQGKYFFFFTIFILLA